MRIKNVFWRLAFFFFWFFLPFFDIVRHRCLYFRGQMENSSYQMVFRLWCIFLSVTLSHLWHVFLTVGSVVKQPLGSRHGLCNGDKTLEVDVPIMPHSKDHENVLPSWLGPLSKRKVQSDHFTNYSTYCHPAFPPHHRTLGSCLLQQPAAVTSSDLATSCLLVETHFLKLLLLLPLIWSFSWRYVLWRLPAKYSRGQGSQMQAIRV